MKKSKRSKDEDGIERGRFAAIGALGGLSGIGFLLLLMMLGSDPTRTKPTTVDASAESQSEVTTPVEGSAASTRTVAAGVLGLQQSKPRVNRSQQPRKKAGQSPYRFPQRVLTVSGTSGKTPRMTEVR